MQVRHLNETMLAHQAIPHPGIGPILPHDEVQYHAYYQWVPFVLFAQAIAFYLPHLFWRTWEGGKIKSLVIGLQLVLLSKHLKSEEDMQVKSDMVIMSKPTLDKKVSDSDESWSDNDLIIFFFCLHFSSSLNASKQHSYSISLWIDGGAPRWSSVKCSICSTAVCRSILHIDFLVDNFSDSASNSFAMTSWEIWTRLISSFRRSPSVTFTSTVHPEAFRNMMVSHRRWISLSSMNCDIVFAYSLY